jgi:hypothetical protein
VILIAHRGLFNGYDEARENLPEQIEQALAEGFNAEIDVRLIDGKWWLGHDEATYEVDDNFLSKEGLWIHCKNLDALSRMTLMSHLGVEFSDPLLSIRLANANYFWHQNDDYTLTSRGFVWTYPGGKLNYSSIRNQPEWAKGWFDDPSEFNTTDYFGVCSKFVRVIRDAS